MSQEIFDPNPRFWNHMCHWKPWAEHYKNEEGPMGTLALMLGGAMEEIERLLKISRKEGKAQAELLFAYIELVDRLCFVCSLKPHLFGDETTPTVGKAFASIKQLNRWRAENKLNIKAVDVL